MLVNFLYSRLTSIYKPGYDGALRARSELANIILANGQILSSFSQLYIHASRPFYINHFTHLLTRSLPPQTTRALTTYSLASLVFAGFHLSEDPLICIQTRLFIQCTFVLGEFTVLSYVWPNRQLFHCSYTLNTFHVSCTLLKGFFYCFSHF